MAIMEKGVQMLAERMPKVITPKTHAIIDYATAGSFFVAGALLWNRNKRAALGAMLCGAMEAGTAMMTDFPGGVKPVISFQTHGRIDAGFAGFVATLPNVLMFGGEPEAMFFRGQGVAIAAVTGLTDFSENALEGRTRSRSRRRRAA
jgi:hypothetical protein